MILLQSVSNDPIKLYINSRRPCRRAIPSTTSLSLSVRKYTLLAPAGWQAPGSPSSRRRKEHRYSLPNTRFMIHQPLGGVRGQGNGY